MRYASFAESREAKGAVRGSQASFLPEPDPCEWHYPLVSVDDHVLEPPDLFTARLPRRHGDRIPRMVDGDDGGSYWLIGDDRVPLSLMQAGPMGRPIEEWNMAATRLEELRPGAWDPTERLHDMDLGGVAMSLCFPSTIFGFTGRRLMALEQPELVMDAVRAYNDWMLEEWVGADPERFIPCQIPYLLDPMLAAGEVRRNGARGFKAISFSENPEQLGLPSIYGGYWDPLVEACEETQTVINLHVGSSSVFPAASPAAPMPQGQLVMAQVGSIFAASIWLWSKVPVRFPGVKIVFSEGGIGWVQLFHDSITKHTDPTFGGFLTDLWPDADVTPLEAFKRNFRFATLYDMIALENAASIGIDTIMFETDYPHADSTWPDCQGFIRRQIGGMSAHDQSLLTHRNAVEVYGQDVPARFVPVSSASA